MTSSSIECVGLFSFRRRMRRSAQKRRGKSRNKKKNEVKVEAAGGDK
jgi:hypothetical protein